MSGLLPSFLNKLTLSECYFNKSIFNNNLLNLGITGYDSQLVLTILTQVATYYQRVVLY